MAISRDTHGVVAGATDMSKTLSLTLASGSVLFASCYSESSDPSITWNGISLTQIVQAHSVADGYWLTVFFLGNPTSGTHNLISNYSQNSYNDLYGASYLGASTSTPTVFDNQTADPATSINASLSTTGGAWYFGVGNGTALSGTANATLLDSSNPDFQADFDSNGLATTNTMTISRSGSGRIGLAAVAFQASGTVATTKASFLLKMI